MNNLKPCPLCGCTEKLCYQTERELLAEDYDIEATFYSDGAVRVICSMSDGRTGCGASSGWYLTKAQAADAWNTRHERTCQVLGYQFDDLLEYWETELTCGCTVPIFAPMLDYCPKCGAKVVE